MTKKPDVVKEILIFFTEIFDLLRRQEILLKTILTKFYLKNFSLVKYRKLSVFLPP